ncbi:hypothetical protein ATANTOWER_024255 [Ataeniobius toweri]|uniref:Uncharacterized protein n=1 Tax=Ataeniobius toweri TaxID=208326 RepID=A0ABU7CJA5_9TELE|nr:hypothetical protein [Ataeniobius toweri]
MKPPVILCTKPAFTQSRKLDEVQWVFTDDCPAVLSDKVGLHIVAFLLKQFYFISEILSLLFLPSLHTQVYEQYSCDYITTILQRFLADNHLMIRLFVLSVH